MDLFDAAEQNAANIQNRFDACLQYKTALEQSQIKNFAGVVFNEGRVSINMKPWSLSSLLSENKYQNIYEWAADQTALSGSSTNYLKQRLGNFYDRRLAFDNTFTAGRNFRYGALNIGGVGASNYGQFCVVLKADFMVGSGQMVYLTAGSLFTYTDVAANVDLTAICQDATPHDKRHCLASIKHATEIATISSTDWPPMVCSSTSFVEAIFAGDVTTDCIEAIRLFETEYKMLWDLAFDSFSKKLPAADLALANDFVQILRKIRDTPLNLERI